MAIGTVRFFEESGGSGFIETDESDDDVLLHMEDVGGPDVEECQAVEFGSEDAGWGPRVGDLARS